MPVAAGYMMMAGHFSRNLVSSGDLNRGSQDGVPRAFYVTFCTTQKVTTRTSLQGVSRFYKPRISAQNYKFAQTKLKPFSKGVSRFCEPRISAQNYKFALTKLNPFAALRRPFPTFCKVQKVGQKTLELSFRKVCPFGTARSACITAPSGRIEVWKTSIQRTKPETSHKPKLHPLAQGAAAHLFINLNNLV